MKKWFKIAVFMFFMFVASFATGCSCEPPKLKVNINFINAEEELGFASWSEEVKYGESIPLELKLPAGYDHTKIIFTRAGKEVALEDWEVNFEKELPEEEKQYEYSIGKTMKYTINFITANMDFNIDMSEAGKETFDITLDDSFKNLYVQGVAINEESLERLIVLDKNNSHKLPRKNTTITARYGDYVALIYNRTLDANGYQKNTHSSNINALYGDVLHFTDSFFKRTEGKLTYTEYAIASKGNTKYFYDDNSNSHIFYIGQVKEDMNIYAGIPNFQAKLGFDLKEDYNKEVPNTFYLLSNSNDYSGVIENIKNATASSIERTISTPISVDIYRKTSTTYDANNDDMDKLDNVVIEKVTPEEDMTRLYNRYDGYKLYVGDKTMNLDTLLSVEDKKTTAEELYAKLNFDEELFDAVKYHAFRLKFDELKKYAEKYKLEFDEASATTEATSYAENVYRERTLSLFRFQMIPYENFDLDSLNSSLQVNLIENCNKFDATGNCYPNIIGSSGNYYVKINKDILKTFILDRSYVDDYTAYEYKTGTAILYVSFQTGTVDDIDCVLDHNYPTREYFSRIMLDCNFIADTEINPNDYQVHAYIDYFKDNKYYRDFGYVDYLMMENKNKVIVYFKTSLLVDENGLFKDNFYIYIMGTKYENFTTPMINQIMYKDDGDYLDNVKDPISAVQDRAKSLHGIASFKFDFNDQRLDKDFERHVLDEYRCSLDINIQHALATNYKVSFKNCEALATTQDNLYVTNNASFQVLTDFTKINSVIKMEDNLANLGNTADIYYFIDNGKDFEVYLDPNNKNTCITTTKTLCDITGKAITIDLGYGKPREIKVKYLIPVYETYEISADGYYFFAV